MDHHNGSRSLFDNLESPPPAMSPPEIPPPAKWLFVTNHMNLCHILSAGLITSPGAFRKYYLDTLSIAPGWIPVYGDGPPAQALELATRERKTLRPCLLDLDLSLLTGGRVWGVDQRNNLVEVDMEKAWRGGFTALYITAPLPLSMIKAIYFKTRQDLAAFKEVASQVNNVPVDAYKSQFKTLKRLFSSSVDQAEIPCPDGCESVDAGQSRVQAVGGMTAMLAHMANLGDLAMETYKYALNPDQQPSPRITDPRLATLGDWISSRHQEIEGSRTVHNFWKVIDIIAESQSGDRADAYLDNILALLSELAEANSSETLKALPKDLYRISGFADQTLTEMFEKHQSPSSRALALLFTGITTAQLLEFKHPLIAEPEKVFAAILFGARDGWLALPLNIRDIPKLDRFVSHQMAVLSHQSLSGLQLGAPPAIPSCLRELLTPDPEKGWTAKQKAAALHLARKKKWDCLETHIRIPKGDYPLTIDGKGAHIKIQGDVPVDTIVDLDKFFEKIGTDDISKKLEGEIRSILKV